MNSAGEGTCNGGCDSSSTRGISIGCSSSDSVGLSDATSSNGTVKSSLMVDSLNGRELGREVGLDSSVVIDTLTGLIESRIVINGFIPGSKGISIGNVVGSEAITIGFREVEYHDEEENS